MMGQNSRPCGSFIDVTEQMRQQDELGRLTRKLDGIPGGVAVFKRYFDDLQCVSVNSCLEDMLGVIQEKLVGKTMTQIAQAYMEAGEGERFLLELQTIALRLCKACRGNLSFP
jgi:PAS domain-containing protein